MEEIHQRVFSFGVITDIQYADRSDGANFEKSRIRYYRNSLKQVQNAVHDWKNAGVDFVLNLGDIIDGHCKRQKESLVSLEKVLNILSNVDKPIYYLWGNHELYNFHRHELREMKSLNPGCLKNVINGGKDKANFQFKASSNLRIVSLDSYAISTLGLDKESAEYKEALHILRSVNTNKGLNCSEGLPKTQRRFVEFNGGIGKEQMNWLDSVLADADALRENVIIICHVPIYCQASGDRFLSWDSEDVIRILHKHNCVFAVFAGHFHAGGYAQDDKGIHHVTFEGVVEADPASKAHTTVDVYETGLCIKGSRTLSLPFKYPTACNRT